MENPSYIVATGFCFWKFRRLPTFHTYAAKLTHFLVAIAGVSLVLDWSVWPLRVAATAAILTNLETIAIISMLNAWKYNVSSIFVIGNSNLPVEGALPNIPDKRGSE